MGYQDCHWFSLLCAWILSNEWHHWFVSDCTGAWDQIHGNFCQGKHQYRSSFQWIGRGHTGQDSRKGSHWGTGSSAGGQKSGQRFKQMLLGEESKQIQRKTGDSTCYMYQVCCFVFCWGEFLFSGLTGLIQKLVVWYLLQKKLSLQCWVILLHCWVRRVSPSFARNNIHHGYWKFFSNFPSFSPFDQEANTATMVLENRHLKWYLINTERSFKWS